MAKAIGLRIYRISVHSRGDSDLISLQSSNLAKSVPEFFREFILSHANATQSNELERSWYFENRLDDGLGNCSGHVHYGTFGFESNLIDSKTKKKQYKRKKTDVEEIPLYYDFWFPDGAKFGFMALQSFQGRSCVNILTSELKKIFETENGRHILGFKKIMPNDAAGSAYYNAPVKRLTLFRRRVRSDAANNYFGGEAPDVVNISVSVTATRSGSLGRLKSLLSSIPTADNSVIMHDGMEFSEATAEIRVGKKLRRVGVFGPNTDAGTIDLSDVIVWGDNGHPTFESVKSESDSILNDFLNTIIGAEE